MKKYFLTLSLVSLLLGCSTRPFARPHYTSVPAARRFEPSLLKPSHRRVCAVTLIRERGVEGSGLNLYLDHIQIARISSGEVMTIYVKPGRHLLAAGELFRPRASRRLVLQKGEATAIRVVDRDDGFEFKSAESNWRDSLGRSYRPRVP